MGLTSWAEDHQTLLLVVLLILTVVFMLARAGRRDSEEDVIDTSKVGNITVEELSKYCGVDPFRPLYLAVRGVIFDVTTGRDFYGPSAPKALACKTLATRTHVLDRLSPSASLL